MRMGREKKPQGFMVLHYLSTWNYEKVNINLKEASETIDGKHVQRKKKRVEWEGSKRCA